MKKNFIYVAIICATTFAFASCGSKESKSTGNAAAGTEEVTEINSINQAIDEYEKFVVEDYLPAIKNAAAGDMAAITKMQEAAPKLQAIAEKFSDTSNFTPAQIKRLNDIAQKISDAVMPQ